MFAVTVCPANSPTTWTTGRHSTCSVPGAVINRLSYASPAWWGFVSADDRHRLEAFLRRSTKLGYRSNSSANFTSICDDADNQLFDRILNLLLRQILLELISVRDGAFCMPEFDDMFVRQLIECICTN